MSETHWKKLTNPDYLGSWDFQEGEERTLTIARVAQEEIFNTSKNSKEPCVIAHFAEKCKPMVLNKTNCKAIQELYGTPIIEKWTGLRIAVKVEKVKAFGKLEEALRVQKKKPPGKAAEGPSPIPACGDCGGEIAAFGDYTAEQVAAVNHRRYGVALCAGCGAKRKEKDNAEQ